MPLVGRLKAMPRHRKATMRTKYCNQESVFQHICNSADRDGIWSGDDATLAKEFNASEDEAHATLSELCDRNLIEKVLQGRYAIVNWRERDDPAEGDVEW
jgi:hypothetical protein